MRPNLALGLTIFGPGSDLMPYEAIAAQIISAVRSAYFAEFEALRVKLEGLKREEGV